MRYVYAAGYPFGIKKSTDEGNTWTNINTGLPAGAAAYSLLQDPAVFYGRYAGTRYGVYRTTDDGANWIPTALSSATSELPVYGLTNDSSAIYAATNGGVYRSTDSGASWSLTGLPGLTGPLAVAWTTPPQVFAGIRSWADTSFATKINATGTGLVYSTYLGGRGNTYGNGIAVDASGNVHVTGQTDSLNLPVASPYQAVSHGLTDAFVSKLNSSATSLLFSTYLGGSGDDKGSGITLDGSGNNIYVTGETNSPDFPLANAIQSVPGGSRDMFISQLRTSDSSLLLSTYLGGSALDSGKSIALGPGGSIYVAGASGTPYGMESPMRTSPGPRAAGDFPTTLGAFQTTPRGFLEGVIVRLGDPAADLALTQTATPAVHFGNNITYSLAVTNNGPLTANSVVLSDALPGGMRLLSTTSTLGSCAGTATVNCSLGTLAPGAGATVTITVAPTTSGTINNTASVSATEADPNTVNNSATGVTVVSPTYMAGDAHPAEGCFCGWFGDDSLDNLDLILALRAVVGVPGYVPAACSDQFDAMDTHPPDGEVRGGDSALNNFDLIITLRRITMIDPSRPHRAARGLPCEGSEPLRLRRPRPQAVNLELGRAEGTRVPVYVVARNSVDLAGLSFSLGGNFQRFVPAGAAPTLTDSGVPGYLSLAWLEGLRVPSGRLLLGWAEASGQSASVHAYGLVADVGPAVGRPVTLKVP